ncbi:MAG: HYR domain-containing protein [Saprospiraceae bacterium]|nr:HYR domain-containing protein [Saprospiraceae bacterium]
MEYGRETESITVNKSGTYHVTVTNENGCTGVGHAFASLSDKTKPVAKTKNINVYLDNVGMATITSVMIENGSTDNCGIRTMSINKNIFTCSNLGPNTVILTVTDNNGNTNTSAATVTLMDHELPKLNCPADKKGYTKPGQCYITCNNVPLGTPSGLSDNCGIKYPLKNNAPASYSVGINNVMWTVTDNSGNTSTCNQKITVISYICGSPSVVTTSEITKNSAKVKWLTPTCATGYQLIIRQEITPGVWTAWTAWASASGPGNQHVFTGLFADKNYQFQARSICGTTFSGTVQGTFKTIKSFGPKEIVNRALETEEEKNNPISLPMQIDIVPNPARNFTSIFIQGFENDSKDVFMIDLYGRQVFLKLKSKPM